MGPWIDRCQTNVFYFLTSKWIPITPKSSTASPRLVPEGSFTPKDFLDLASRDATDQALLRLVQRKTLKKIGRGLYHAPRRNDALGIDVPPDLDEIADAVGRQTGSRIVPSGAVAANRLGLSTQVPAKPVYLSDGRTRTVRVGKYTLQIKHVSPKDLPAGNRTSAFVFQALRFLGKDNIDDQVIKTIRSALTMDNRRQLLNDAKYTAEWLSATILTRLNFTKTADRWKPP